MSARFPSGSILPSAIFQAFSQIGDFKKALAARPFELDCMRLPLDVRSFSNLAVRDPTKGLVETPKNLTAAEHALYEHLKNSSLRLEQERVPLPHVNAAVKQIFDP